MHPAADNRDKWYDYCTETCMNRNNPNGDHEVYDSCFLCQNIYLLGCVIATNERPWDEDLEEVAVRRVSRIISWTLGERR